MNVARLSLNLPRIGIGNSNIPFVSTSSIFQGASPTALIPATKGVGVSGYAEQHLSLE